jgi:hypothetical protein
VTSFLDVARRVPGLLSRPKGSYQDAWPDGERLARDARTLGTRVRLAAARTYTGLFQRRSERHPLPNYSWRDGDYIGGVSPSLPKFTRGACSVPSGCFFAAAMKILAPGLSSLLSLIT